MNLFKKARFNLLTKNKFVKYLLYALGEIALVVIGILLALQINNWKEDDLNNKQETKLLLQLKSDLTLNQQEVVDLNKRISINKQGIDSLIMQLQNGEESVMTPIYVNFTQRKSFFNKKSSGYNMIQNGMATYIKNKTILSDILELYENDFTGISQRQVLMHTEVGELRKEYINKLFRPAKNELRIKLEGLDKTSNDLFAPLDFKALSSNVPFLNNLMQLKNTVERRLVFIEEATTKTDRALQLIEQELKGKS